jgi:hypothetical protein
MLWGSWVLMQFEERRESKNAAGCADSAELVVHARVCVHGRGGLAEWALRDAQQLPLLAACSVCEGLLRDCDAQQLLALLLERDPLQGLLAQ